MEREAVERVARVLCRVSDDEVEPTPESLAFWSHFAEAAIAEAMAILSEKPTEAMKAAVRENGGNTAVAYALAAWPDLLFASPLSQGGQADG